MRTALHDRRGDIAQRWASILVGLAVVGVAGWMTMEGMSPRPIRKDAEAGAAAASAAPPVTIAPGLDAGAAVEDLDGGLTLRPFLLDDASVIPSSAPRNIRIGVALVTFAGAEGAPASARSKREAATIAERLGEDARADFHRAVTAGDSGSADDIGRIPRGVLDPRTEAAVFALAAGEISGVLETPRGYWIVKRIE